MTEPSAARDLLVASVRLPMRPRCAPGVEVVGQVQESGFAEPVWLVRRGAQYLQVTALLAQALRHCTGENTLPQIAERMSAEAPFVVPPEVVERLLLTKILPLGLIDTGEAAPPPPVPRGAMSVQLRMKMLGPKHIDPLTRVLQHLYGPPILIPALFLILGAHIWLYLVHGVGQSIALSLRTPGMLLLVLGVLVSSIVVHELGHAAALRYGGGIVRGIGIGLYLIYPAFYTDTTDAYRLGRWGRVRTDLGGFYFHLLFALLVMGIVQLTGLEALLVVVVLINVDILRQLLPFARFDGYWTLVDLTGMPDVFSQLTPLLRRTVPGPWQRGVQLPALRPWVRGVLTGYLLLLLPVLLGLAALLVVRLPTMLSLITEGIALQATILRIAMGHGLLLLALITALQLVLLGSEVVGLGYMVLLTVVRPTFGLLDRLHPRPRAQRAAGSALAAGVALVLLLAQSQDLLTPGLLSAIPRMAVPGAAAVAVHHYPQHPPARVPVHAGSAVLVPGAPIVGAGGPKGAGTTVATEQAGRTVTRRLPSRSFTAGHTAGTSRTQLPPRYRQGQPARSLPSPPSPAGMGVAVPGLCPHHPTTRP